ncbi:MAG TPA: hypothetical protein VH590_14630 [Ktedonobacterales bacterium]
MTHDEDSFTPEEQAQAEAVDRQIDARLRAQPVLPPDQRETSDALLIGDLTRFYQPQAEAIRASLHRARERVEQRGAQSFAQRQPKPTPLTRLKSLRERRNHVKRPWSFWGAAPGSSRLAALAAALLLAVLVGGLVAGLILVRSRGSATANPTAPTATLAPGVTQIPTKPVPTQTPASVPSMPGLVYIHMLDASSGWAITGQNHILRTTDGANHWQDVTPPSIDPPQANYANLAYDFLSPSIAWVYSYIRDANDTGGTTKYYRTMNGGQRWLSQINHGDVPSQIIFTNSNDGWMFSGTGVALGSSGVDIFRTINGGATWAKVASAGPSTINQPGALPFDGDKTGIGARDAMTAWVTGTDNNPSFVWLYVTRDGGQTWQHQTLPLPPAFSGQVVTNPPTFLNAQDGMLPVLFLGASIDTGEVFVTHDGGATWQSTSFVEAGEFDFINANQGWATNGSATGGSTLYTTSDGGRRWTKLPTGPNQEDIEVLNFVSAEVGWAIDNPQSQFAPGPTILLKTTDGGRTWTVVPSAPSYKIH